MRLASADRRSFSKWLWGLLGVLAWVLLASVFGASQASAHDGGSDAGKARPSSNSASTDRAHPAPGKAQSVPQKAKSAPEKSQKSSHTRNTSRSDKNTQARNNTQARSKTQATHNSKANSNSSAKGAKKSADESRSEPARSVPARSAQTTAPKLESATSSTPSRSVTSESFQPASRVADRDDLDDRAVRDDRDSDFERSTPKPHADHDKRRADKDDDRGYAWGKAHWSDRDDHVKRHAHHSKSHAKEHSKRHAHRAWLHGSSLNDSFLNHTPRTTSATWHPAPAPAQTEIMTNAPVSPDRSADGGPTAHAPVLDDAPITEPWSAPAQSGAAASGTTQFQIAGDTIAGDPQLAVVLLGIRTSADDRMPSGPTSSTDSSPD